MQPQCVFCLGIECSGTRLLKSIFLLNGYTGGHDHQETWGNVCPYYHPPFPSEFPAIVWRFSYPMGNQMPRADLAAILAQRHGYQTIGLLIVRDGFCAGTHPTLPDDASLARQSDAAQLLDAQALFSQANQANFTQTRILTYASLIRHGARVFQGLDLYHPITQMPELHDANQKWYEPPPPAPEPEPEPKIPFTDTGPTVPDPNLTFGGDTLMLSESESP